MERKIAQIIRRLNRELGAIDIKEPTKGSQREYGEADSDDPKPDMLDIERYFSAGSASDWLCLCARFDSRSGAGNDAGDLSVLARINRAQVSIDSRQGGRA